jgi:FdhE protein
MSGPAPAALGAIPGEVPPLVLPEPSEVFRRRAARLAELARGHASGDWLLALSRLAAAQGVALERAPADAPGSALAAAVPLRASGWRLAGSWRAGLGAILAEMRATPLPVPARAAIARLEYAAPSELESFAGALLRGGPGPVDLAAAPFVAAALQAHFTALASRLDAAAVERSTDGCPVCGSPPVAAVVLGDDKVRYVACSLCSSRWHLVRVQCATCRATGGISYLAIEGGPGGVKAEACGTCRTYLKVFYLEQRPGAEPLADDAATLALDLLVAEEGYARGGRNLFLDPGVAG